MTYLEGLNDAQRTAVTKTTGPLLVLAGAGTGKTRVLTARIAHLIATDQVKPDSILCLTFNNKAVRELRERLAAMPETSGLVFPWLGTFHAIGAKILRRHAEAVGLTPSFTVLDGNDQSRVIKNLLSQAPDDPVVTSVRTLADAIDDWKNSALASQDVRPDALAGLNARTFYSAYQARLKALDAADFGDLLLEPVRLFHCCPEVLAAYRARFTHILVDEYQDTNAVQDALLRLIATPDRNITCVGDDDQAIYGWRGADVGNILQFTATYTDASIIRLEQNYRSTGHILACASGLIAHNTDRLGKTLVSTAAMGRPVIVRAYEDDADEAASVCQAVSRYLDLGAPAEGIAILVRASFQMRGFEEELISADIPYRVVGGMRFYDRTEIKDAVAYLALAVNPNNDVKFQRVLNTPKRGLGETLLNSVSNYATTHSLSFIGACRRMLRGEPMAPKTRTQLAAFVAMVDGWHQALPVVPHLDLAEQILEQSGLLTLWRQDQRSDAQARVENLRELLRSLSEFQSLPDFLEHTALVTDTDSQHTDQGALSLMTLHAAKGLEFDTIYLTGWEDGLFPHQRALTDQAVEGLQEERRLAYVGLTRARRHAEISYAAHRRNRGLFLTNQPSRFLAELPAQHVNAASSSDLTEASRNLSTSAPLLSAPATPTTHPP